MTHHTDNILNSAEEDFVKSKLNESCLTNWTEIYHRSTAHVCASNGAKIFNFRKVDFFDVFKYLIVIIRQSDMESKYFFQKSKIPLDLCTNTKFQMIRIIRSVWNRRQQNMKYIWSLGTEVFYDLRNYASKVRFGKDELKALKYKDLI